MRQKLLKLLFSEVPGFVDLILKNAFIIFSLNKLICYGAKIIIEKGFFGILLFLIVASKNEWDLPTAWLAIFTKVKFFISCVSATNKSIN